MDPHTQAVLIIIAAIGTQIGILIAAVFAGMAARDARRIALDTRAETQAQTPKIDDARRIALDTRAETQAQTTKIDLVATKTAVIEGHVNSEKTSDAKTIEYQARENQLLRDQILDKDRVAGLLAQAVAARTREPAAGAPIAGSPVKVEVVNDPLVTSSVGSEPPK
jgi:hypothetical protein